MILSIIFSLLIVSIFLVYVQKRLCALCALAVSLLVLVGAGSGLLTKPVLVALQKPYLVEETPAWSARNAIVLLGFGTQLAGVAQVEPGLFAYSRLAKTVEAYQDCKKLPRQCMVIVSGGDPRHHGVSEAQTYSKVLQAMGVGVKDLLLENKSNNTWQNAQFSAVLLTQNGFSAHDTVLLVTSGFHMQRSLLYFANFGVSAHALRADYADVELSWTPQSMNLMLADVALHEYFGLWRSEIYTRMGWNAPKPSAGVAVVSRLGKA